MEKNKRETSNKMDVDNNRNHAHCIKKPGDPKRRQDVLEKLYSYHRQGSKLDGSSLYDCINCTVLNI